MNMQFNMLEKLADVFFAHQIKIKMCHFQTSKYSVHKTLDKYLDTHYGLFDKFMETAQGNFGKLQHKKINISVNVMDCDDSKSICDELDKYIELLRALDKPYSSFTELLNIRDELVGEAVQLKYLLTFQ